VKTEKTQEMKRSQAIYLMENINMRRKCKEKSWSISSD